MLPQKQAYTVAQVQEILRLISFSLNAEEHFYIVMEYAELLSPSSGHVLLKSLEEPPRGYHFILLTESIEALLPTIVSRCLVQDLSGHGQTERWARLLSFFCGKDAPDCKAFDKECERELPPEYETRKLVESLIAYWLERYHCCVKKNYSEQAAQAYRVLKILEDALTVMPMPGSAKLFWRTLFLKIAFLT